MTAIRYSQGDFLQFQTENNAALQLIEKAKNRLYKFYRPNLHKEAPKQELTDEEKILAASGRSDMIATEAPVMIAGTTQTVFVQFRAHVRKAAPPPPPDTWGAYQKKDGKSNGVIGLMDMLMKELQGDVTEATHDEETSLALSREGVWIAEWPRVCRRLRAHASGRDW